MQWEFTCPKCRTTFTAEGPDTVQAVPCPTCGILLPVPAQARQGVTPSTYLAPAPEPKTKRETNWILWIAGGFAALWAIVIVVMLLLWSKPTPKPQAVTPAPPVPVTAPVKKPLFDVNAPAEPASQPTSVPVATTPAKPPPPELRIVPKAAAITDEDVVASIKKGIDFLLSNFDDDELKKKLSSEQVEHDGMDALCVYALLHCSQSMRDERITPGSPPMRKILARLKAMPMVPTGNPHSPVTYARALRAAGLALYDRPEDRNTLRGDVQWLLAAHYEGAYTYDDIYVRPNAAPDAPTAAAREGTHPAFPFNWDNSNSQYGLLGVWCGAETGISIPGKYWKDVVRHWTRCQYPDGTWGYSPQLAGASYSMTCAGIAALSVARDYLELAGDMGGAERAPADAALAKAIEWLDRGDNAIAVGGLSYGYSLYSVERAALASGILYPGRHDIYRELVTQVVPKQSPTGAFGGAEPHDQVIETAFHLLFLARGRNPVMMNKLRYAGQWDAHTRDLANLTKFATDAMERPVNWQVVNLTQPWSTWLDAPILYIAGSERVELRESDYEKIRQYVNNGGMLFTHADNGSEAFNAFAVELAKKIFPNYEMTDVPLDDDLFNLQYVITQAQPKMRAVSNGSRRLMIHCTGDIASQWEQRSRRRRVGTSAPSDAAMQLGVNLFIYATGKGDLRSRLDSPYVPPPSNLPAKNIPIARLQYAGNWDPEPAAWERFERYFWWETGWDAQPRRIPIAQLTFPAYSFAHLTGTTPDVPTEPEAKALRAFVNNGGVLFIDACGGSQKFTQSVQKNWLPAIFPDASPRVMSDEDPIMTGKVAVQLAKAADDLTKIIVRRYTAQVAKPANSRLLEMSFGKGRVIISELDVTSGLLGTEAWGVSGYAPAYAQSLLKNILLWAASRE